MLMTDDSAPFLDAFHQRLGEEGPAWLAPRRQAGMDRFATLGFPTRRQEAWRFTDLTPLTDALPSSAPSTVAPIAGDLASWLLDGPTHRVVLVDGRVASATTDGLPAGAWLGSLADALRTRPDLADGIFDDGGGAFAALNAALFSDGVVLALDPGVVLERPVEIIHHASVDAASHVRLHLALGAGARATVVETAAGGGAGWGNQVTTVALAAGAVLRHVHIQAEGPAARHTALVRAVLGDGARYDAFALITGGRLSRRDVEVTLAGDAAAFALHGAYLLRDAQEATLAVRADHHGRDCRTEQGVKGVLAGASHGVFLGTVAVRPGADGTDARQLNRNLLLSPTARIDTKPELEILADDVKCSHGATVGSLDEASLFYLQARGIDPETARRMLVAAFAGDVVDAAGLPGPVADLVHRHLQHWLHGEGGEA
ncbi:MAG: Fe-S cluster assembly protein SufD [Azospirillaceae bacterium]|nr:Fe-S cluster assembly protein SufD [Azospirillaceae bacterium]